MSHLCKLELDVERREREFRLEVLELSQLLRFLLLHLAQLLPVHLVQTPRALFLRLTQGAHLQLLPDEQIRSRALVRVLKRHRGVKGLAFREF